MFSQIRNTLYWLDYRLQVAWYSSVVTTKARQLEKKRQYVTPDLYEWADRVDSLYKRFPNLTTNSAIWKPGEALEILGWIAVLLDEYTKSMSSHVVSTKV